MRSKVVELALEYFLGRISNFQFESSFQLPSIANCNNGSSDIDIAYISAIKLSSLSTTATTWRVKRRLAIEKT
jgi:hypothetical protein